MAYLLSLPAAQQEATLACKHSGCAIGHSILRSELSMIGDVFWAARRISGIERRSRSGTADAGGDHFQHHGGIARSQTRRPAFSVYGGVVPDPYWGRTGADSGGVGQEFADVSPGFDFLSHLSESRSASLHVFFQRFRAVGTHRLQ